MGLRMVAGQYYAPQLGAIEEIKGYLGRLDLAGLQEIAALYGITVAKKAGSARDQAIMALAQSIASPYNTVTRINGLSQRELALLRQLAQNAGAIAAAGMVRYFAPVLSRASLEEALTGLVR